MVDRNFFIYKFYSFLIFNFWFLSFDFKISNFMAFCKYFLINFREPLYYLVPGERLVLFYFILLTWSVKYSYISIKKVHSDKDSSEKFSSIALLLSNIYGQCSSISSYHPVVTSSVHPVVFSLILKLKQQFPLPVSWIYW